MIVVFVLGVIGALTIPAFSKYVKNARAATFCSDVRSLASAAQQYSLESGWWVEDTAPGEFPAELEGYFSRQKFKLETTLGGVWDFENWGLGDFTSAVGVQNTNFGDDVFQIVDDRIDDGDLTTGFFQKLGDSKFYYVIVD